MDPIALGTYFARQGWYPSDPDGCQEMIRDFTRRAEERALPTPLAGRAGIVPHAGWVFSGRLAALTLSTLARGLPELETLVLLGGHLGPRSKPWILTSGRWPTPMGDVALDAELARAIAEQAGLPSLSPDEYEPDNTIELQMPLIRALLPAVRVVPAGIPATPDAPRVGEIVVQAAADLGRRTAVVGSTDLTHYGPNYAFEPMGSGEDALRWVREQNDRRATELMTALDAETLLAEAPERRFCCCPGAASATLSAARAAGARAAHLLEAATSYDTRPDASFVGYASVAA